MQTDTGRVRLHVEVEGNADAPAVVFLHGLSSSANSWSWLPRPLTAGRRIVRLDLRGHGRSAHAPGTYDIEHFSSDVAAVLTTVTNRPAVFVGHSLGGVIAWWIAQRRPDLVAAALLEDPPLFLGTMDEFAGSRFDATFRKLRAGITVLRRAGFSAWEISQHIGAVAVGRDPLMLLRDTMTDDALEAMGFAFHCLDLAVLDSVLEGSMMAALDMAAPVTPATLVLAADDGESAFPIRHAQRLAQTHPRVEVVRIAGSSHGMHEDRRCRDVFSAHLARFLTQHAA